jgi:hypothetical protein
MAETYIRIGTEYYKKVQVPISETETISRIVLWKKQTIIDDYGKEYLKQINSYEGVPLQLKVDK